MKEIIDKKNNKCPKCGGKKWKDTTNVCMVIGTWKKHRECEKCGLKQSSEIF
jgi:hypothetical protein